MSEAIEREKKIAEIRKAAEKPYWNVFDDARSIANAPEWLRFLLELFDEAKKEAEFWKNEYEKGVKRVAFLGDSFERLRQERDKLIEGLRMATELLGTVPMNDGRLCGVYNKLCDILHEIGGTVEWQKPANDMWTTR